MELCGDQVERDFVVTLISLVFALDISIDSSVSEQHESASVSSSMFYQANAVLPQIHTTSTVPAVVLVLVS